MPKKKKDAPLRGHPVAAGGEVFVARGKGEA
jgi:hypothetical protein